MNKIEQTLNTLPLDYKSSYIMVDSWTLPVAFSADGSTALVGAHGKSTGTGAAYIFTKSGSTWSQQSILAASDAAE